MKGGVKTTIMVLGLIGSLFFAYFTFFNDPVNESVMDPTLVAETHVGQDMITLLDKLKALQLDTSIFSSKSFLSLTDYSQTIVAEPIGRNNPFSPPGSDGVFVSTISLKTILPSTSATTPTVPPAQVATTSATTTGSVPVKNTSAAKR